MDPENPLISMSCGPINRTGIYPMRPTGVWRKGLGDPELSDRWGRGQL